MKEIYDKKKQGLFNDDNIFHTYQKRNFLLE